MPSAMPCAWCSREIPPVHATAIQVGSRDGVVTFDSTISAASERTTVEHDAWYVWGVRDAVNHVTVRA